MDEDIYTSATVITKNKNVAIRVFEAFAETCAKFSDEEVKVSINIGPLGEDEDEIEESNRENNVKRNNGT